MPILITSADRPSGWPRSTRSRGGPSTYCIAEVGAGRSTELDLVDVDDVGMVQPAHGLRLAQEAPHRSRAQGEGAAAAP